MSAVTLPGHGTVDVRVRPQSSSLALRLWARVRPVVRGAWVTIGRTIYHPDDVAAPLTHAQTLAHEQVHVRQWRRMGLSFALKYATAQGRWEIEREAFLHEVVHFDRSINDCVNALASDLYRLKITREAMRDWFHQARQRALS